MKLIILMCLIAAVCELLLRAAEWIREAKELINSEDYAVTYEYSEDIETMLSNNTAFTEV